MCSDLEVLGSKVKVISVLFEVQFLTITSVIPWTNFAQNFTRRLPIDKGE